MKKDLAKTHIIKAEEIKERIEDSNHLFTEKRFLLCDFFFLFKGNNSQLYGKQFILMNFFLGIHWGS